MLNGTIFRHGNRVSRRAVFAVSQSHLAIASVVMRPGCAAATGLPDSRQRQQTQM